MACIGLKPRVYGFLSLWLEDIHMFLLLPLVDTYLNSFVLVVLYLLNMFLFP